METSKLEKRTFYVRLSRFSFPVPIADETGKKVLRKHPLTDAPQYFNSKPLYIEEYKVFETVSTSPKLGYLSKYETSDPKEIEILTSKGMAHGSGGYVMTEEQYKREKNPDLYNRELEMKATEGKYRTQLDESEKTIADLKNRLAEATKQRK